MEVDLDYRISFLVSRLGFSSRTIVLVYRKMPREQNAVPIIAWATGKKSIAKLDLTKAFHSVPVAQDQIGIYSFLYEGRYYTYKRVPEFISY